MTEHKQTSTLKFFNEDKGFGFIKSANSDDYFVHISDINDRLPTKADVLAFDVVQGDRGPKAINVEIVEQP